MRTRDITLVALFVVIIAICSWISIPTAVPFTLQILAIYLALLVLGGKLGTICIILYLFIGLVGVPVFSKFSAGPAALFGMTGGYLLGFLLIAIVYYVFEKIKFMKIPSMIIGLLLTYAFGTLWFVNVFSRLKGNISIIQALSMCVIPFVIPDIIKMIIAYMLSIKLNDLKSKYYR